jgi:hypothetical protein
MLFDILERNSFSHVLVPGSRVVLGVIEAGNCKLTNCHSAQKLPVDSVLVLSQISCKRKDFADSFP